MDMWFRSGGARIEELTERELELELMELIRSRRLRPASCLARSWEEPNITGYTSSDGANINQGRVVASDIEGSVQLRQTKLVVCFVVAWLLFLERPGVA